MAKLSAFRRNMEAVNAGVWVPLGPEFGNARAHLRGFTDEYHDARSAKIRAAAQAAGLRSVEDLPGATARRITAGCLADYVVLGVEGLERDDGAPLSREEFCAALRDPAYGGLFLAVVNGAAGIGLASADAEADAAGNSPPPSA